MTQISSSTPTRSSRTGVAWLLYAALLLGNLLLAAFGVTSVFMTDSCGSVVDELAVCGGNYLVTVLVGYWIALAVIVIAAPIAIVIRARKGRAAWIWPLGGIIVSAALTVLFVMLMTR